MLLPDTAHRLRQIICAAASSEKLLHPADPTRGAQRQASRRQHSTAAIRRRVRLAAAEASSVENSQKAAEENSRGAAEENSGVPKEAEADGASVQSVAAQKPFTNYEVNSRTGVDASPTVQPSTRSSAAVQSVKSDNGFTADEAGPAKPVDGATGLNGVAAVMAEGSSMVSELLSSILPVSTPPSSERESDSGSNNDSVGSREDARPLLDADAAFDSGEPSTSGRVGDSTDEASDAPSGQRPKRRSRSGAPAWPMATVLFDMGGGPETRSMRKGIVRKPRPRQQPSLDASLFSAATARANDAISAAKSGQRSEQSQNSQPQARAGDNASAASAADRASASGAGLGGRVTDGSNPSAPEQGSKPGLLDAAADAAAKLLQLTSGALKPQPEPHVMHP